MVIIARLPLRSVEGCSRMSSRCVNVCVVDDSGFTVWTVAVTSTDCAKPATTTLQAACAAELESLLNIGDVAETDCGVKLPMLMMTYCP